MTYEPDDRDEEDEPHDWEEAMEEARDAEAMVQSLRRQLAAKDELLYAYEATGTPTRNQLMRQLEQARAACAELRRVMENAEKRYTSDPSTARGFGRPEIGWAMADDLHSALADPNPGQPILDERDAWKKRAAAAEADYKTMEGWRDKAAAVVKKLPKTADGVPYVPGDPLWAPLVPWENTPTSYMFCIGQDPGNWPVRSGKAIKDCYSTREAAEAARDDAANLLDDRDVPDGEGP